MQKGPCYSLYMSRASAHRIIGWIGTALAIVVYGAFAAGLTDQMMLFSIGNVSSLCLIWALLHDRTYYAAALQSMFLILNTIGIVRILFY